MKGETMSEREAKVVVVAARYTPDGPSPLLVCGSASGEAGLS